MSFLDFKPPLALSPFQVGHLLTNHLRMDDDHVYNPAPVVRFKVENTRAPYLLFTLDPVCTDFGLCLTAGPDGNVKLDHMDLRLLTENAMDAGHMVTIDHRYVPGARLDYLVRSCLQLGYSELDARAPGVREEILFERKMGYARPVMTAAAQEARHALERLGCRPSFWDVERGAEFLLEDDACFGGNQVYIAEAELPGSLRGRYSVLRPEVEEVLASCGLRTFWFGCNSCGVFDPQRWAVLDAQLGLLRARIKAEQAIYSDA